MKGPRQVKQVVFPFLRSFISWILGITARSAATDVLGLLWAAWVSVNPKDNDSVNPAEGFVDSVSVLLTWNCWVRYSHLNFFCLPEIPQSLSCLVGLCDPLSNQWRRKYISRDTFSPGGHRLCGNQGAAECIHSRQSCSSDVISECQERLEVFGVWFAACIQTLLFDIHIGLGGKLLGKNLWFQHSEGKYACLSSQDRAKAGKLRPIRNKT